MTLEEAAAHIGEPATYTPYDDAQRAETGVITAVTSRYVFVRYTGDQHSKATAPDRLWLAAAGGTG
jgi:hypothetical protein